MRQFDIASEAWTSRSRRELSDQCAEAPSRFWHLRVGSRGIWMAL